MSADAPKKPPNLDEGCRILTISTSLAGSAAFVARLKTLEKSPVSQSVATPSSYGLNAEAEDDGNVAVDANAGATTGSRTLSKSPLVSSTGPYITPYTLANRYYTAEVHFAAYALDAVFPGLFSLDRGPEFKPPPAVVFVWREGEPYAKLVEELTKVMEAAGYDPEVCLAVCIPRAQEETAGENEVQEEDTEVDTTLMSYGFEYVDGRQESLPRAELADADDSDDIPRLPRVLDALSTIMWPSMHSSSSRRVKSSRAPAERSAANAVRREWEQESIMEELFAVSGISGISRGEVPRNVPSTAPAIFTSTAGTDDELDVLFSPYDFTSNAHLRGAPSALANGVVASPTEITPGASPFGFGLHPGAGEGGLKRQVSMGFEDDFMVVVSAPPEGERGAAASAEAEVAPGHEDGRQRKARPTLNLDDDAGIHAHLGAGAGLGLGDTTPIGTAFADSVRTGDNLTPASALSTGTLRRGHKGPPHRNEGLGMAYRSLGSVSDFGDFDEEQGGRDAYQALGGARTDEEDDGEEWEDGVEEERDESWEEHTGDWDDTHGEDVLDEAFNLNLKVIGGDGEEEEEGMPTREEIVAAAARIFGGVPVGGASGDFRTAEVKREREARPRETGTGKGSDPGLLITAPALGSVLSDSVPDDGDDNDALGPTGGIDIERVLRSLQGLKTEIAGVEDEEERRRMAARVALGFVYGMDLDMEGKGGGA